MSSFDLGSIDQPRIRDADSTEAVDYDDLIAALARLGVDPLNPASLDAFILEWTRATTNRLFKLLRFFSRQKVLVLALRDRIFIPSSQRIRLASTRRLNGPNVRLAAPPRAAGSLA